MEISKAIALKIQDLDLKYSWAAKGEKAVQIPGLPEDLGETTMEVIMRADSRSVLAADSDIKYSEENCYSLWVKTPWMILARMR